MWIKFDLSGVYRHLFNDLSFEHSRNKSHTFCMGVYELSLLAVYTVRFGWNSCITYLLLHICELPDFRLRNGRGFLGAFAKLRKATVSFVMSVRPEETTRLALEGSLLNLVFELFFFENLSRKFKFRQNPTRITDTFIKDVLTFMTISRLILLRTRNILDKSCRENKDTHFMFDNFFPKILPFMR